MVYDQRPSDKPRSSAPLDRGARPKKTAAERRVDKYGAIVLMAEASGYVMVRRPRCVPFVLSKKEWDALETPDLAQYFAAG